MVMILMNFKDHTIEVQGCKGMEEDTVKIELKIKRQHLPPTPIYKLPLNQKLQCQ